MYVKILQSLFGLGITLLFLYILSPFFIPIFLGGVLAIIFYPLFLRLRKKIPTWASSLSVTLLIALAVLLPIVLILYSTVVELQPFVTQIGTARASGVEVTDLPFIKKAVHWASQVSPFSLSETWLDEKITHSVRVLASHVAPLLGAFIASLPKLFLGLLVILLCVYFFFVDGNQLVSFLKSVSPWSERRTLILFRSFTEGSRAVVLGFLASGFAQGILVALGFAILSIGNPLLFGGIAVLLAMIPALGGSIVMAGGAVFLFINDDIVRGIVAIALTAIISVSDNFVKAWVMKGKSEIHPLLTILSALGAISALGVVGVFLGPVIAVVFLAFAKTVSEAPKA